MKALHGKQQREFTAEQLKERLAGYDAVCIDVGTGSGRFVLNSARRDPACFYIGIDPVAQNMAEIAVKAEKLFKRDKQNNTLFVVAAVEAIPDELNSLADKITVYLPWGSLRDGIVTADAAILKNLRLLGKVGSEFISIVGYDDQREPMEMERRSLPQLSLDYFQAIIPSYRQAGINLSSISIIGNKELQMLESDWARRLAYGAQRRMYCLEGRYE